MMVDKPRSLLVVALVVTFVAGGVVGSHATKTTLDPAKVDLADANVQESNLDVVNYTFSYDGHNVTHVNVDVDNTDTADLTGDVSVQLAHGGTAIASATKSSVTFTGGTVTTVQIAITEEPGVNEFDTVDVTVSEA